jgi:isoleucyl-tRNA synthetase
MNFSKTINLPKTNFSMKANLSATENNWIEFWKKKKSTGKLKIKVQNP